MFHSFFPRPKLFFGSFVLYAGFCVVAWFGLMKGLGPSLSLGGLFGWGYPEALAEGAEEAVAAAHADATAWATQFWFYQYKIVVYALFVVAWMRLSPHKWEQWSVIGSAAIIFFGWVSVQLDVVLLDWIRRFYNLIQDILQGSEDFSEDQYYSLLNEFLVIALALVILGALLRFFISHYVFRWRTAMNDYYVSVWPKVRRIEGASQRVQEDTMRFAEITQSLGDRFIDSFMTLIAFLPILWVLSEQLTDVPVIGAIPGSLVWIALAWSIGGTALLMAVGIKLPGIFFRIQREEAAYRKELVIGEDDIGRAKPEELSGLYKGVRYQHFQKYFHFVYFDVARITYLQVGVLVPFFAMAPSIIAGAITLGVFQQIARTFDRVERSFQFLVYSWSTIVELLSIHKRLQAFEKAINDIELDGIETEILTQRQPAE
ncbi:MAG: peptide antibiotic transporter SbmA [Pseudomonadota bacterium]